mgnify:CR=1 FL=1|jgi:predicted RNA-binding protein with PUA-like domain
MATQKYWLFKSEPTAYSYVDLQNEDDRTAEWDGVRNYQARNLMRDEMKVGDRVLFYHSNAKPMAVIGTATIVKEAYPDHTSWDPESKYYDPKSGPHNPIWMMVDIKADEALGRPVTLLEIKQNPALQDMPLVRKGMRLSVQPVTKSEWDEIISLGHSTR